MELLNIAGVTSRGGGGESPYLCWHTHMRARVRTRTRTQRYKSCNLHAVHLNNANVILISLQHSSNGKILYYNVYEKLSRFWKATRMIKNGGFFKKFQGDFYLTFMLFKIVLILLCNVLVETTYNFCLKYFSEKCIVFIIFRDFHTFPYF